MKYLKNKSIQQFNKLQTSSEAFKLSKTLKKAKQMAALFKKRL